MYLLGLWSLVFGLWALGFGLLVLMEFSEVRRPKTQGRPIRSATPLKDRLALPCARADNKRPMPLQQATLRFPQK